MVYILEEGFILSTEKWHLLALQGILKDPVPFRKCYFDLPERESELFEKTSTKGDCTTSLISYLRNSFSDLM